MAFKLKNHQLNNRAFVGAIKDLGNVDLNPTTAWNVKRMIKQMDKALGQAGKGYVDIVNEFCKKDEEGKITPQLDKEGKEIPNSFVFEEGNEEKFQDAMKSFMNEEYEIKSNLFNIDDLDGAKLSATTLMLLEPIMVEE